MDPSIKDSKSWPRTSFRDFAQLLKERHRQQDLRHVEGASGDEGLDVFGGELYGKPVIWQCKAFPNGVGKSQKEQIRESLRTALTHFLPLGFCVFPLTWRRHHAWGVANLAMIAEFQATEQLCVECHNNSRKVHRHRTHAHGEVKFQRIKIPAAAGMAIKL